MIKTNIKNLGITTIRYILLLIILISSYIILLILPTLIPTGLLTKNVRKSSETLHKEGEIKNIDLKYKHEDIFTFTDALMINIAYSQTPEQPLESALLGRKNYIPGQTQEVHIDTQYNLGASPKFIDKETGDLHQTQELFELMHNTEITDSYEYARYWHGYNIILRPLLAITTYSGIRTIMLVITIALVVLLLYKLYKKFSIEISAIFLIGLLSVSLFAVTQGINEILVFIIALIASNILLYKKDLSKGLIEIFFIIGSVTNFIDLLTAPLVTLGIPLIICILLLQKENNKLEDIIKICIKICFSWGMAYAITWISKWIITQLIFKRPIISQAIEQAKFRIGRGSKSRKISYGDTIQRIFMFFSKNVYVAILSLLMIYIITKLVVTMKKRRDVRENIRNSAPYIVLALFPFMWYFILKQHSFVHGFFTYRNLIISVISVFIIVYKLFEKADIKKDKTP